MHHNRHESVYTNPNGFPFSDGKNLHMEVGVAFSRTDPDHHPYHRLEKEILPTALLLLEQHQEQIRSLDTWMKVQFDFAMSRQEDLPLLLESIMVWMYLSSPLAWCVVIAVRTFLIYPASLLGCLDDGFFCAGDP